MVKDISNALAGRLKPPPDLLNSADMQVQEIIYGHRFIQEQEPFMIVLETLAICAVRPLGSIRATAEAHEEFKYALPHRRKMRFLLFQERYLEKIVRDRAIPDSRKWQAWKDRVNKQFGKGEQSQAKGFNIHDAFAHLDEEFSQNINDLYQAVRILRSRELDVMHDRRSTSRFLAVTGPDMICSDLRELHGNWTIDRRFFGRGGELVYLMLNRSPLAEALSELIGKRLFKKRDPMNRLAKALSDESDNGETLTQIGYLPHLDLPAYARIAEDWRNILSCKGLPDGHLFEPLFRITALNLVAYAAERSAEEMGNGKELPIVADLSNGENRPLREEAKMHLNRHRDAADNAVKAFVEKTLEGDERWRKARQERNSRLAREAIESSFFFKKADALQQPSLDPEQLREKFIQIATRREKNNIHKYLLPLARQAGLANARARAGTWFALDDDMLFALVFANVEETVELRIFVERLYERYRLVIGPREAQAAFGPRVHVDRYKANLAALERRMTRLALTQRLSDDCAFVINPYRITR